jgi:hypothetical protein
MNRNPKGGKIGADAIVGQLGSTEPSMIEAHGITLATKGDGARLIRF